MGSAHSPILPFVLLSVRGFLGNVSVVFSKFWYVASARIPGEVVCDKAKFSGKNRFAPKIGKMEICSTTKIYIICCVPAQILYLGKFWFLRYGPKCSQSVRSQYFLINHISRTNQWKSLIFRMLVQIHIK